MRALFARFPSLVPQFAHADLGVQETPVDRMVVDGAALFIKRDDLTSPALGGNKVRALEFLLARAGRDDIILTVGSTGSTHALATAFYAGQRGSGCETITWPQEEHAISRLTAARLGQLARVSASSSPVHAYISAGLRRLRGGRFWVPAGGSSALGALGHASAALELVGQLRASGQRVTRIVLPLGSGGTVAGLVAGLSAVGERIRVVGVRVVPRVIGNRGHVLRLAWQTHRLIAQHARERVSRFDASLLEIEQHEYGGAYGRETPRAVDAARVLAAAGGPPLDGTYSAKAFACALARAGRATDESVLFWLTFDARWLSR